MSSEPGAPQPKGSRVWVAAVGERDIGPYRRAVEQSRQRLARWNPVDPDDLGRALSLQSRDRRTFLIHVLTPECDHDIVGKVNVSDVVRGRFESAAMGYDAYDPTARGRRVVALVNGVPGSEVINGVPGSGTANLARQLAVELRIPLFSRDVAGSADMLWALLADSPVGGVVESCFRPDDARYVVEGLQRCGLDPAAVPEVWCFSAQVEAAARPVGLGPTLAVDMSQGLGRADVVRIALQVGAWLAPVSETQR